MYRETQTGIKHFEQGDKVSLGKGKVIYTVLSDVTGHEVHIESTNTGRASTVDAGRLVLFLNVRDTDEWKEADATASALAEGTLSVPGLDDQSDSVPAAEEAPEPQAEVIPEHIPGETPAEYKERTGKKLDGRTTAYGRVILAALQPKLWGSGPKRPRRSKIMARKPQAK